MNQCRNLYDYLYQVLLTQFLNGAFQYGQIFPSQREICLQYNVGITTARKAIKILSDQGYIRTAQGHLPIVTYKASKEEYIAFLVRSRDEIADAYRGLGLLMPVLYREGAKRCKKPEIIFLHKILDGITEQMSILDLYKQANTFFTALLRPMKNRLIIDLELDSENYLHIPYIPLPGVENPHALTAERLFNWIQNALQQIEHELFDDFCAGIIKFYQESANRIDNYLCALSRHSPVQHQIKGEIHWFRPKGRSELYARLAMTIIRRIVDGEFDGQKYLPSIPKLMEEYGVMKDTASRAVALINSLGFAQTIDKKGTVITIHSTNTPKDHIDLMDPVIQERLTLFMEAFQIVKLTAQSCASSFSSIPPNLASLIEGRISTALDSRICPLSFQLLMNSFIQLTPYHSLKNIFRQLEELIIWGHYLQAVDHSFYPNHHNLNVTLEELVAALRNPAHSDLPGAFGKAFSLIYQEVIGVASQTPACSRLSEIFK